MRAQALVITYADTASALRILHHAHELRAGLPVIVRVKDEADMDKLQQAGAAEVVPEALESSLMLASHALLLSGVPLSRVVRRVRSVRESRYGLLRGFFHGAEDTPEDLTERLHPRLHSVVLPAGAHAVGRLLGYLALDGLGVEVVSIRRHGSVSPAVAETLMLEPADVVVIKGNPESIALAEAHLLNG